MRNDGAAQVWELDLTTFRWRHVECKGHTPPYRIHSSAAVVMEKWLIHGGRKPGKFNVTNCTYVLDFATWRYLLFPLSPCASSIQQYHAPSNTEVDANFGDRMWSSSDQEKKNLTVPGTVLFARFGPLATRSFDT